MKPQSSLHLLPPGGAECRGSGPACAGLDGTKARGVSPWAFAAARQSRFRART